jgi:hypothetical protein
MNQTLTAQALLQQARSLEAAGQDEAAKASYIQVLRLDCDNYPALCELGNLALSTGHRSAAQTAYRRAVELQPGNAQARVNLGNLHYHNGELPLALEQFEAALRSDPECVGAHQGLACALEQLGETQKAQEHWQRGFIGHAVVPQRFRGRGAPIRVLQLVSTRLGNVATSQFLDQGTFAVTLVYVDAYDPEEPLPAHDAVFNGIGDADLCGATLRKAQALLGPVCRGLINPPSQVLLTDRAANARRFGAIQGIIAPRMLRFDGVAPASLDELGYPLLLRAPGFHTGRHFVRVERAQDLAAAVAGLPSGDLLAMEYLDARGMDGMSRKYRVMFIDGELYPLHLAVSHDWKVHYFSAAMADTPLLRAEEQRFLEHMPQVLGERAMRSLRRICAELGLDYAGIDFGLAADGSVLLFEANATMAIFAPGPEGIWDYRRAPINAALQAARRLVVARADNSN